MSVEEAARRGLKPLARIVASATAGIDPAIMGMGKTQAFHIQNFLSRYLPWHFFIGKIVFLKNIFC